MKAERTGIEYIMPNALLFKQSVGWRGCNKKIVFSGTPAFLMRPLWSLPDA